MYETAGKHFQMDPKTEDLLPNGRHLTEGMVVLLEDHTLREHAPNEDGEHRDKYAEERYLENNRWCVVTKLQDDRSREQVAFVGVYEDGTKAARRYDSSYAWFYKVTDEGSPIFFDRPEQDFVHQPTPADALESEQVDPVFRVVATYQMFGDMEGKAWFEHVFAYHYAQGDVVAFEFLSSLTGAWGLQYVTFTVDLALDISDKEIGQGDIRELATGVLCGLVGDSDVEVHGFEHVGQQPTKS